MTTGGDARAIRVRNAPGGGGARPALAACLAAMAVFAALAAPVAAHPGDPGTTSAELTLLGHSNLTGKGRNDGLNGEVAVVGTTAVVATGLTPGAGVHSGMYNPYPCPRTNVKLVDISDPARPARVGNIQVPGGVAAMDVDALHVSTPAFTGDLAAVALAICGNTSDHHGGSGSFEDRGVAYYDVTDPARPVLLGRYKADLLEFPTTTKKCGRSPRGLGPEDPVKGPDACSSSQHSVDLQQRVDGTVLSVSTEPFATASGCFGPGFTSPPCFAGDLRIVDVTDPRNPVQLGSFPESNPSLYPTQGLATRPSGFSSNGCRPFSAGHDAQLYADGTRAALAYLDDGVRDVDLSNPSSPSQIGNVDPYPPADRLTEGNGGYVTVAGAGEDLALLSDEDWIAPHSWVRVDTIGGGTDPSAQGLTVGSKFACEAMFTLFDPEDTAQIYRHDGLQVPAGAGSSAELVYVGRGCPVNESFGTTVPDPYVSIDGTPVDVSGKIAVLDRVRSARQSAQLPNSGSGCSFVEKALRAQGNGAIAVVFDATFGNPAFSPDGSPAGLEIPVVAMDRPASTQLINTLCPTTTATGNGDCASTIPVRGALVDTPGAWGGLRVVDLATSAQVGTYATPRSLAFPPPDLGVYAPARAEAVGDRAYVAWNSDGVRVLDLSNPAAPVEVAHFVPPDTPDPRGALPAKAYVTGVEVAGCNVLVTDVHSGLYVLHDAALCP